MADPKADNRRKIQVNYPLDVPLSPAHAANFVHFSQAGLDVLLSLGQVDIARMAAAKPDEHGNIDVRADVTHRFLMSLGTLMQLRVLLDQLVRQMEAQGVRLPEPNLVEDA